MRTFRIAGILVVERKTALRKSYFEIPRAVVPGMENDFWGELQKKAQEQEVVFTRFFPQSGSAPAPHDAHQKGVPEIFPEETLVIDLSKSETEILAQMKQKGRYNINLAKKKGVRIVRSTDIGAFHHLLEETGERDGFSFHPKAVYESMLNAFGENGFLYLAEYEGKVIAGGIFLLSGNVMTYYYGASSNEYRNVMAPYLIQWTAIEEAKRRGAHFFDFLGIAPEGDGKHRLSGVSEFKEKFGGIRFSYPPAFEIVHRKLWYRAFRVLKRMRK